MIIRVVDFETCGLPERGDGQIVEVATVDLYLVESTVPAPHPGWQRGRMWSSLINPGCPIPPTASAINHITDEMVADKRGFNDALIDLLDGSVDVLAAHNSRFEIECARLNERPTAPSDTYVPLAARRWIDTYRCALAAWPDAPAHGNQVLRYWLKLRLADDAGPPHRALGDAYVTAAILRRLLVNNSVEQLLAASSQPALLPRLTFGKYAMMPIDEIPTDYLFWITTGMKDAHEDVLHTAMHHLQQRRSAARQRSPV